MVKSFVAELKQEPALYILGGILLFYTFISFYDWSYNFSLTATAAATAKHTCWPYFQNCGWLYWFEKPPHGFGINLFFMLVFSVWAASVWAWFYRKLTLFWWGLLFLLGFKVFVAYIYTDAVTASYDFYHTFLLALFLFTPSRLFFLQVFIALCYLLSATLKIAPAWFNAEAFADIGGLPLLDLFLPVSVLATLLFLCFAILPWFLFLNYPYRLAAFLVLALFHLYTVMVVGFHYPALMLPVLWALFILPKKLYPPFSKDVIGWGILSLVTLFHMWSFVIPGDEKITGEGVRYGLYMFDAQRHCHSLVSTDGKEWRLLHKDEVWGRRCYVYREWFYVDQICQAQANRPLAWQFKFSAHKEGPFQTLVDTPNACELTFRPFWHNDWIQVPERVTPWWYYWVWGFWGFNVLIFIWVLLRLK